MCKITRSRTERSEASDHPEETPKAATDQDLGFEAWRIWAPCPDGRERCERCGIDYATYLAVKAMSGCPVPELGSTF